MENNKNIVINMDVLDSIQAEHKKWHLKNFDNPELWESVFGMIEELGELAHVLLKRKQNIRPVKDFEKEVIDAVGDLMIFTISFCNKFGINLRHTLITTWNQVKQRDWKKYPKTGRPDPEIDYKSVSKTAESVINNFSNKWKEYLKTDKSNSEIDYESIGKTIELVNDIKVYINKNFTPLEKTIFKQIITDSKSSENLLSSLNNYKKQLTQIELEFDSTTDNQ